MNPRIRRLQNDHEQVQRLFANHPVVSLVSAEGSPPEKYTFEIKVAGLVPVGAEGFSRTDVHRAEVLLSLDYPRRPPFCRMVTPVFHPNIDPQKICIGDHWNAGQSLAQLVVRIAEMISFQSYNTKSPLNAYAAAWAEQHADQLPLAKGDLSGEI
jgi:ubiquitin-protein ligase